MTNIVIIDQEVINEIRNIQFLILKKLDAASKDECGLYISKGTAANMLDCDDQTIANFEKEGLIKRYGRKKFIRYSLLELRQALGMQCN